MNNIGIKIYSVFLITAIIMGSCTSLPTDADSSGSNTELQILYPVSNDTIGVGVTVIDYSVSTPFSLKFMELYINGSFAGNFPPGANGLLPEVKMYFDSSFTGKSISYYLIYYDKNGTSKRSESITNVHIIETVSPPAAPYNLAVTKITPTSINLSWSDSSKEVDRYEIWRKTDFDGTYIKYADVDANVFNMNDENLDSNKIYFYKIKSFNRFGASPFSDEVNTAGVGSSGNLYPPTNLLAVARGTKLVHLNWKDNSDDENLFVVERRTIYTEFVTIGVIEKNVTAFTDISNELFAGGEYYYRVKAFSNTDSAWSNEAYVKTYLYDIPAPENLRGFYLGNGEVLLDWVDVDQSNTLFQVERKDSVNGQFVQIAEIPGDQNSYLDGNLNLMKYYVYRVRSGDGTYVSDYSIEVTVYTGN